MHLSLLSVCFLFLFVFSCFSCSSSLGCQWSGPSVHWKFTRLFLFSHLILIIFIYWNWMKLIKSDLNDWNWWELMEIVNKFKEYWILSVANYSIIDSQIFFHGIIFHTWIRKIIMEKNKDFFIRTFLKNTKKTQN